MKSNSSLCKNSLQITFTHCTEDTMFVLLHQVTPDDPQNLVLKAENPLQELTHHAQEIASSRIFHELGSFSLP